MTDEGTCHIVISVLFHVTIKMSTIETKIDGFSRRTKLKVIYYKTLMVTDHASTAFPKLQC